MDESKVYDVLLIEDDEIDRLLVRTLLNSRAPSRFQLSEAPELPLGLELLRTRHFDLVLLDHTMPQLTSIQELRLVLAQQGTSSVIMHTGYIDQNTEAEALRMGVGQVVEKGELDPLWSSIERSLEHLGSSAVVPQPSSVRGKTVLVVEDERAVRRIIRLALEFADYTVHDASNAEEGLELMHRLGRAAVDLVILDLMMPGTSGNTLAAALQRLRAELPVLIVSGVDAGDLRRAMGRTPSEDEVLFKPFTPDQLVERVAKLLSRSASSAGRVP
jgi:DNA-binding response OmpR family regulator